MKKMKRYNKRILLVFCLCLTLSMFVFPAFAAANDAAESQPEQLLETDAQQDIPTAAETPAPEETSAPGTPKDAVDGTGSLTIEQTVSGFEAEVGKKWDFTVKLTPAAGEDLSGAYNYTGTNKEDGTVVFTESDGSYTGTVQLRHAQGITIENLPAGITYTVVEKNANADGYKTYVNDDMSSESDKATGTILANETVRAAFKSLTKSASSSSSPGSLTVTKVVTGNGADTTKDFTFTVTFSADVNGSISLSLTFSDSGDDTTHKVNWTDNKTVTFTLKGGQNVTISNIPCDTTYTVTETADPDYTTTYTGSDNAVSGAGTIGDNDNDTVTVTNARNTVTLPTTGGPGRPIVFFLSVFSCLAGVLFVLMANKHKNIFYLKGMKKQ